MLYFLAETRGLNLTWKSWRKNRGLVLIGAAIDQWARPIPIFSIKGKIWAEFHLSSRLRGKNER